jgi:hypothetical protein
MLYGCGWGWPRAPGWDSSADRVSTGPMQNVSNQLGHHRCRWGPTDAGVAKWK